VADVGGRGLESPGSAAPAGRPDVAAEAANVAGAAHAPETAEPVGAPESSEAAEPVRAAEPLGALDEAGRGDFVAVAVDLPGPAGLGPLTYHVPPELGPLEPGEAVVVEVGRRHVVGVVVGRASPPDRPTKPVGRRVRSDGPLFPPLSLALAAWVSRHYLVPLGTVLRAFLPPGLLDRLELVAELTPAGRALLGLEGTGTRASAGSAPIVDRDSPGPVVDGRDRALLEGLAAGRRPVRSLPAVEGRVTHLRRLRRLGRAGLVELNWELRAATAGPRLVRWARLTERGRAAAVHAATPAGSLADVRPAAPAPLERGGPDPNSAGPGAPERRLGPRQRAALVDLLRSGDDGMAAAEVTDRHGPAVLAGLARRGLVELRTRVVERRPLAERPPGERGAKPAGADLTASQAAALSAVEAAIRDRDPTPILLDGVTGAGKTAVYAAAIAACLASGRAALVLVPEIPLAVPLVDRLRRELDAAIAVLHSGLSEGERADEWRRIRAGGVEVVVGTRIAVAAPLADVGLVVVDEEHDPAYKSDRTPRLQARDAAVELARLAGAACLLGSATPSVESVGHARAGRYRHRPLTDRPAGGRPIVEVVDLRAELAAGNRGMVSGRLAAALAALDTRAGERAILVINRRGSASVVLCRDCGEVLACPDCGRPLVYHQVGAVLRCHVCGLGRPLVERCPACRSPRIRFLGGGTERVEREVRERFPQLRVGRLDRDVVERRGAATAVLDAFAGGELDVLVGTSLVAKGIDVPEVTLVGIVSADVALNLPDERAAERTYQLLVQAIGRAGRGDRPGRAIVQTYQPAHPVIEAVASGSPEAFYEAELDLRQRFGSPPFGRLVKLVVAMPDRDAAHAEAERLAAELRERARRAGLGVAVSGPAPGFVPRRNGRWRFVLVLRGIDPVALLDPPPGPPWSVDVDPESTL
jgi:primosomal protein N' (replication factor Y)